VHASCAVWFTTAHRTVARSVCSAKAWCTNPRSTVSPVSGVLSH
jgi:hypothetical protein